VESQTNNMFRRGGSLLAARYRHSDTGATARRSNPWPFATEIRTSSSATTKPLIMGCVSYDPSVANIWSGIQDYLVRDCGVPFEYVLFDSYEEQVAALAENEIDIAWNGPVAHVMAESVMATSESHVVSSLGMRDVDRDFASIVIARKDAVISSLQDLEYRQLLTGANDSPQACIVPHYYLTQEQGVNFEQMTHFDVDIGKHGDTAIGEIRAIEALIEKQGEVATVSRMMWDRALSGALPSVDPQKLKGTCEEVTSIQLPTFDHCQFDAILAVDDSDKTARLNDFGQAILGMNWENPKHQPLMKLEGIEKEWKLPRQEGYDIVRKAFLGGTSAFANHKQATNFQYQKRTFSSTSSAAHAPKKPLKVAVIGAGIAGLQAIRALSARGFDVTAFEASSKVGGLWKSNYSNFGVQVPKQLFEFQDFPMTQVKRGEYATGPQVQAYIESYVDEFGLRHAIQCNAKVTSVSQTSNEINNSQPFWNVETMSANGNKKVDDFDYLVVATGLYSNLKKYSPSKPGQDNFEGDIVHSSDYCDATVAKDKNVIVIGGGKSAVDCALEASKAGASSVTLLQRNAHWPTPRMIAGIIPFQYIFLSRLGTALVSSHRGTFPGSGPVVNAFRNSVVGPLLMRPVFGLVEELFAFQFGLRGELRPKGDVVSDFYKVALVLDSELKEMRESGKLDVKLGEIESFGKDGSSVFLKDGSSLTADLVVAATGFSQDFSYFSDPSIVEALDIQKDGLFLYNYMLPEKVPNLAFLGNVGAISNISSYGLQAEWLARHLTGDLIHGDTLSQETMREEIEARKEWARSWIPESSNRGNLVLLHQTHYHDKLLKEMGENPHRKSNIFSEYFMPYECADYSGIMGGGPSKEKAAA